MMLPMDNTKRLTPLGHLARRLRVPVRWLRAEAEAGRLPHVKAEKQLLFDAETVERLLLERATAAQGRTDPNLLAHGGQIPATRAHAPSIRRHGRARRPRPHHRPLKRRRSRMATVLQFACRLVYYVVCHFACRLMAHFGVVTWSLAERASKGSAVSKTL